MKKLQLKEPVITEGDHSVLVAIRHERLASPEKMIMDHVKRHGSINNREGREITSIDSEYRVRRIIRKLVDANELEQIPGTRTTATRYRRPEI